MHLLLAGQLVMQMCIHHRGEEEATGIPEMLPGHPSAPPRPTPLLPALLPSPLLLLPSQALLSSFTRALPTPSVGRPVSPTDKPQPRQQGQVGRSRPMPALPLAYPRPASLADAGPGASSRPTSQELREVFTPV